MTRESFLDALRHQYAEEVQEAYLESLHGRDVQVDLDELRSRLNLLSRCAAREGLKDEEFQDLVQSTLPEAA